jgi:hypothetical protein
MMRRSQVLLSKIQTAKVSTLGFDELLSTLRLEDETQATVKDLAARRFMDLLHLNANSLAYLHQTHPLGFSELSISSAAAATSAF